MRITFKLLMLCLVCVQVFPLSDTGLQVVLLIYQNYDR